MHSDEDAKVREVSSEHLAAHRHGRIVVGVDGSFGADAALRWAIREARERGLVLDVVAVWEDLAGDDGDGHLAVARERLDRALEHLLRRRDLPKQVITAPLHGAPGLQLVERARDADFLVLGTTGISSPEIPGGIGLFCLRNSSVPVVFVPGVP